MSRSLTRKVKQLLNHGERSDSDDIIDQKLQEDATRGRTTSRRKPDKLKTERASGDILKTLDDGARASPVSPALSPPVSVGGLSDGGSSPENDASEGVADEDILQATNQSAGIAAANAGDTSRSASVRRKIGLEDAENIIGGDSLESLANDHGDQTEEIDNVRKEKKVFKFALPFSNPFPSLDIPTSISGRLSFGSSSAIQLSLEDMAAMDQEREDELFAHVRVQDNSRSRAVRTAIAARMRTKPVSWPKIDGPIVILGGYRGSVLRDRRSGSRVWIPLRAGLNMRKVDLSLGIDDAAEEQESECHLYPSGMLTHIGPVDISKNLIRQLEAQDGCTVYDFGYDWRLSCEFNSEKLAKLLENIRTKFGKPAIVIAHSMGGLVAHHAMQRDPSLFRGLLYAGVPSSCPNILGPLRYGDAVLLSSKVLTAKVNFLMRSSFVFLPLDGHCFVDKNDIKKRYDIDFFDVGTWIDYNLSPCVSSSVRFRLTQNGPDPALESTLRAASTTLSLLSRGRSPSGRSLSGRSQSRERDLQFVSHQNGHVRKSSGSKLHPSDHHNAHHGYSPHHQSRQHHHHLHDDPHRRKNSEDILDLEDAVDYLERTLKRTKKFLQELAFKEDYDYPPLATLYGCTVPTLRAARVDGHEGIRNGNYDNLVFGAGDGVVYKRTMMPEARGFTVTAKIPSDRGHVSLLTDIDGVANCLRAIIDEEARRCS